MKRVKKRAEDYTFIKDTLFRKASNTYPTPRRVPPVSERPTIIKRVHEEHGHFGIQRSLGLISKTYFWPGITNDVRQHVSQCAACQVDKAAFKIRTTLSPLPIARLFERVSLDLVGPLTRTRRGHEYMVVCIDAFSKYIIAAPLPNRLSQTVADFFFSQVICRISCPVICRTDHGSEFMMDFSALLKKYGISHQMSAPHRPEANGQVERANKTIIDGIKRNMSTELNTWDDHINRVVYGYNITKQASTNFSPHYLLYNQEPRIGDPLDADSLAADTTTTVTQTVVAAREMQAQAIHDEAVRNLVISQNQQRMGFERRRPMDPPLYDTDTFVLIKKHTKGKKLAPQVEGPYLLKAYNSDHTSVLIEDATGKQWTEHSSFIAPYEQSTTDVNTRPPAPEMQTKEQTTKSKPPGGRGRGKAM